MLESPEKVAQTLLRKVFAPSGAWLRISNPRNPATLAGIAMAGLPSIRFRVITLFAAAGCRKTPFVFPTTVFPSRTLPLAAPSSAIPKLTTFITPYPLPLVRLPCTRLSLTSSCNPPRY